MLWRRTPGFTWWRSPNYNNFSLTYRNFWASIYMYLFCDIFGNCDILNRPGDYQIILIDIHVMYILWIGLDTSVLHTLL